MDDASPLLTRHKLTTDDWDRMGEAGILGEHDRIELIDGEIIDMAPIGADHMDTVNVLTRTLVRAIGDAGLVSVQNPLRLDRHNEMLPDFVVFRPHPDDYRTGPRPGPADVLLVIEVARSSLRYDTTVKLPKYAAAGIPELWIIDLPGHRIHIHREPTPSAYTLARIAGPTGTVVLAAAPITVPLARVLAP